MSFRGGRTSSRAPSGRAPSGRAPSGRSFSGGRGGGREGRGFARGGGRGGGRGFDEGPPSEVVEIGVFMHSAEGEMVCRLTNAMIPYFNAGIYLENKAKVGKVEEVFGPTNKIYFTVKPDTGVNASSFQSDDKVFIGSDKLLPLSRFTNEGKSGGGGKSGGRGAGRGGTGGRGPPRGGSRGGFTGGRPGGRGPSRGGSTFTRGGGSSGGRGPARGFSRGGRSGR